MSYLAFTLCRTYLFCHGLGSSSDPDLVSSPGPGPGEVPARAVCDPFPGQSGRETLSANRLWNSDSRSTKPMLRRYIGDTRLLTTLTHVYTQPFQHLPAIFENQTTVFLCGLKSLSVSVAVLAWRDTLTNFTGKQTSTDEPWTG